MSEKRNGFVIIDRQSGNVPARYSDGDVLFISEKKKAEHITSKANEKKPLRYYVKKAVVSWEK